MLSQMINSDTDLLIKLLTQQATYLQRTYEVRSCNHCSSEEAIRICCSEEVLRITYFVCVLVASVIQHAMLTSVACPAL